MRNKKLTSRPALGLLYILGIVAVIAAMAAYVLPKIGNVKMPAIESNLKQDIETVKQAADQYYAGNNASYNGLTMRQLVDKGYLKGAITSKIFVSAGTLATTTDANNTATYYAPSYGTAAESIKISVASVTGGEGVNFYFDGSGETELKEDLETNMIGFFTKATSAKNIKGDATAISATAETTGVAGNTDGKFLVTYE